MGISKTIHSFVLGGLALGLLLTTADLSHADRRGRGYHGERRHHRPYHHPRRHHHWPRFSLGFSYIYNDWPVWRTPVRVVAPAAVVTAPSVGTVFASLPAGCTRFTVGGIVYYHYDNVYYRTIPSGYVVVDPPLAAPPPARPAPPVPATDVTQVSVTVEVLNVRSAPGPDFQVIQHVRRGDLLNVRDHAEGWLYVELPSGELGWVRSRFTAPAVSGASG